MRVDMFDMFLTHWGRDKMADSSVFADIFKHIFLNENVIL